MIHAPAQQSIHPDLMTSGLPALEDFAVMAEQGYEVVISVRHPEDETQLAEDEDALVAEAGMVYVHLPVRSRGLHLPHYEMLRDVLRIFHRRKVWLHCTHNKRISTLMYVYNIIERSLSISEAHAILHAVWEPDEDRQAFIDEALEKYAYQYL
jgi:uncharacterized protein (TIGR01244 family)